MGQMSGQGTAVQNKSLSARWHECVCSCSGQWRRVRLARASGSDNKERRGCGGGCKPLQWAGSGEKRAPLIAARIGSEERLRGGVARSGSRLDGLQ